MADLIEQLSQMQDAEREAIAKSFRDVLALPEGKRVVFWMLEQCGIYQDAFSGDQINATNYVLGQQAVGRKLIAQLDGIDPRAYPTLLLQVADMKAMDKAIAEKQQAAHQGNDDADE